MNFFSLRLKITGILLISNIMLGILLVFVLNYTVTDAMEVELLERGHTIARNVANFSALQIREKDTVALNEILKSSQYYESVEYIIIHDSDLNIIADTYNGKVPAEIVKKNIETYEKDNPPEIVSIPIFNLDCFDIVEPVERGQLGYVRVGINKAYIENKISDVINFIIIIFLSVIIVGVIVAYLLTSIIIKPILYLTKRSNEISIGKLEEKIAVSTNDEIKYLAEAVERLRESLNLALARLKKHQTLRN